MLKSLIENRIELLEFAIRADSLGLLVLYSLLLNWWLLFLSDFTKKTAEKVDGR
jgi:hypothetical protein